MCRHFISHFRRRRVHPKTGVRHSGAGANSKFLLSEQSKGRDWRLRRLPKQVPGNAHSTPPKKQGVTCAKGAKGITKARGDGKPGEGEDEEEDDELWSLMGPAGRQSSADDDVVELEGAPQSSGDAQDGKAQSTLKGKGRRRRVKKLLQFHDNLRPAYYGTHSTTS